MNGVWFDRGDLLPLLTKRLEGFLAGYRQNVALLGPEGIGKSALLKKFLQDQKGVPGLAAVYLEAAEEDHLEEWASRFVQALLHAYFRMRRPDDSPLRLPDLLEACAGGIPKTAALARRALEMAEAGKADEAYDRLWDLPQDLAQEAGIRVLLAVDEFHRLRCLPVKDPFRAVGRKIMVQTTTLFLAASSQPAAARSILREGLALLFGQFETVELEPLGPDACRRALRSVWPSAQQDPFAEHLLLELAQGQPDRLHLLLRALEEQRKSGSDEPNDLVLSVLESLFLQPQWGLRGRFESRLRALPADRGRLLCMQVLGAVASGRHRLSEIVRGTDRSSSHVSRALRLLELGRLLSRQGPFVQITDRLFEFWMLTAHPVLHGFEWADEEQVRVHYRRSALAWISHLRETYEQPVRQRTMELLRRWEGERVEVEGRQVLLPEFERMEPVAGPAGRPAWEAVRRRKGGRWLILLWNGSLAETEARSLAQELRGNSGWRGHRKLVLGPSPVEVNARLILQEGKIRLWDFHVLNRLFDLYGLARLPAASGKDRPAAETLAISSLERQEKGPLSTASGMLA